MTPPTNIPSLQSNAGIRKQLRTPLLLIVGLAVVALLCVGGRRFVTGTRASEWDEFVKLTRPDGTPFWFGKHQFTQLEYMRFLAATACDPQVYNDLLMANQPELPAMMNLDRANAVCAWETEEARRSGKLRMDEAYAPCSDLEWSTAAGLSEETGATPKERSQRTVKDLLPWGDIWPAGSYANTAAVDANKNPYDPYPGLCSTRFGHPNTNGVLFNGNASDWTRTPFESDKANVAVRGGDFSQSERAAFLVAPRQSKARTSSDGKTALRPVIIRISDLLKS